MFFPCCGGRHPQPSSSPGEGRGSRSIQKRLQIPLAEAQQSAHRLRMKTRPERMTQAIALYRTGQPVVESAAAFGIGPRCLRAALEAAGIPLHPRSARNAKRLATLASKPKRPPPVWTPERHAEVARMYREDGRRQDEIAEYFQTTPARVCWSLSLSEVKVDRCGRRNPAWRGGRTKDKSGYVLHYLPNHPQANIHGYVRGHRLAMQKVLGRLLDPQEVVHHRDGDTSNNQTENLEIFPSNGAHLSATAKGKKHRVSEAGRARLSEVGRSTQRQLAIRRASAAGAPTSP